MGYSISNSIMAGEGKQGTMMLVIVKFACMEMVAWKKTDRVLGMRKFWRICMCCDSVLVGCQPDHAVCRKTLHTYHIVWMVYASLMNMS